MAKKHPPRGQIASLIEHNRTKQNLSQREVGILLGWPDKDSVGQSMVSSWERGLRPIRPTDKQKPILCELLKLTPHEFDVKLREDEVSRARWVTRRRAQEAVARQYENPTATPAPKRGRPSKVAEASKKADAHQSPEVQQEVHSLEPSDLSQARKLPKADLNEAILLALVAGDPDLSGTALKIRSLMRVINRFNTVVSAINEE